MYIHIDILESSGGALQFPQTWCIMIHHNGSRCITMAPDASWCNSDTQVLHEGSWCYMNTHDAWWGLLIHHEYSWYIMSAPDASRVLMMHHEYSILTRGMANHGASGVFMLHQDNSWSVMNTHVASGAHDSWQNVHSKTFDKHTRKGSSIVDRHVPEEW